MEETKCSGRLSGRSGRRARTTERGGDGGVGATASSSAHQGCDVAGWPGPPVGGRDSSIIPSLTTKPEAPDLVRGWSLSSHPTPRVRASVLG